MPVRYKLDQVIEILQNNGCELLSKEYKNNTSILEFRCKCNNNIEMAFKKYLVQLCCDECNQKTLKKIYKYNFEQVKKYFQDNDCELISENYINNHKLLDYICKCKNTSKISFKSFLDGQRCSKCAIEKRKITNLKIYGNECSMNSKDKIQQRKKIQPEITNKRKTTNLEKYGVEIATQNPLINQKREETNLKKYGASCALKLKEYDEKRKNTNIKRYGF